MFEYLCVHVRPLTLIVSIIALAVRASADPAFDPGHKTKSDTHTVTEV